MGDKVMKILIVIFIVGVMIWGWWYENGRRE